MPNPKKATKYIFRTNIVENLANESMTKKIDFCLNRIILRTNLFIIERETKTKRIEKCSEYFAELNKMLEKTEFKGIKIKMLSSAIMVRNNNEVKIIDFCFVESSVREHQRIIATGILI